MNRNMIRDALIKRFDGTWEGFQSFVNKKSNEINAELKKLADQFGPEVVRSALKSSKFRININFGEDDKVARPGRSARKAQSAEKGAKAPATGGKKKKTAKKDGRKNKTPSPARQEQGLYMSTLRKIPKARQGHFKEICSTSGRKAAIAAMREELGIK